MDTSFTNREVAVTSVAPAESVATQPVSPRYRVVNLVMSVVLALGLFVIATLVRFQPWVSLPPGLLNAYPVVSAAVLLLGVWAFTYHWFADRRVRFALREHDLILHKGLFFRKMVCQPMLRIQHVELKHGPVERLAQLATLQVFSAGGAGHTFEIPGLPDATAQQLRQFILTHKDLQTE